MVHKTYSAEQIADFILSLTDPEDNDVSNLKLQKLCFYAQGLVSSMRGVPLFREPVYAWDHGPVVPALYHKFKKHGADPIPVPDGFDTSQIDEADRRVIQDIHAYYGQFSAWRLRNMTHEEKPWADAYNDADKEISVEALTEHFLPLIKEDYVRSAYETEITP